VFSRTHTALDKKAHRFSATQTLSDFPLKMEHVRKNTTMTSVVDSGVKGGPRMTLAHALVYVIDDDENLLSAVKRALERSSDQWLQRSLRKEVRDRLATLTPRECDVLKGVVAGMLNKQIAAEFGTTEGTIKVHRGRVMEKMGATSVAEPVILAQRAGIGPTSTDTVKI
jgi:DNA-binding NarL/FixJ family response regulator